MVGIIKADIVGSRKVPNPELWLLPVKKWLSANIGQTPESWEIFWGDSLQFRLSNSLLVLRHAITLKALVRSISLTPPSKPLDIRMGIGLGEQHYGANRLSESNGPAFIYANESFENLMKEKQLISFKSGWPDLDAHLNLNLQLASVFMNQWTAASAELVFTVLQNPNIRQEELGIQLGIKQNSVSDRWQRAHLTELLAFLEAAEKNIQSHVL